MYTTKFYLLTNLSLLYNLYSKLKFGDKSQLETAFIDCGDFSTAFSVPNVLVDDHINSLTKNQLKLILYILRHRGERISLASIFEHLSIDVQEINETLALLKAQNILSSNCSIKNTCNKESNNKNSIYETTLKHKKPDPSFVVNRVNNSDEIAFLMKEAQFILGRPISNLDCAALIMFHDTDGLPVNVILMLLEYCVNIGKNSMRYIEKVASSWGSEEINTIEKAEMKIKETQNKNKAWNSVRSILGLENRAPTAKEGELCVKWINDLKLPLNLIKQAFDKCITVKGKYIASYIDAILENWLSKGITNTKELKTKMSFNKKQSNKPSYDIEEYLLKMDTFA